jgi:hypothetical protein
MQGEPEAEIRNASRGDPLAEHEQSVHRDPASGTATAAIPEEGRCLSPFVPTAS